MKLLNRLKEFFLRELMLCICAVIALLSMLLVPPSAAYLDYIDLQVLCLLFCLMAVVLGIQECGLFKVLAHKMLTGKKQFRLLSLILVLLPFFCSMLVTNDVAIITFVPFTILVLNMIDRNSALIKIVVYQTLAANLGSMATPIGKAHNLFLYEYYGISAGEFFSVMLPLSLISLIGLSAAALIAKNDVISVSFESDERLEDPKRLAMFLGLFILSLLSVFRVLPYWIPTAAVLICMLCFSRKLLKKVDYALLLTFVCFFIFAGNIGQVPQVRELLSRMLQRDTLLSAILASQIVSNVPASLLLSGFTDDWRSLLVGVNIGGLGTPIASLASLISLKMYLRTDGARPLRYLGIFTLANVTGIFVLLLSVWLISAITV